MRRQVCGPFAVALALALAFGCAAHGAANPGYADDDAGQAQGDAGATDAQLTQGKDASSILESGCATATAPIERDPIYMLMVLDASGSMKDNFKWAAIVPAIKGFIDNLARRQDVSFGLGLTIFSGTADPTGGVGPYPSMDVPIAYVDDHQAAALEARLDGTAPNGETPTYAVLSGQYPLVEAFAPAPPLLTARGHRVLVLMTDGVPYPDPDKTQRPSCIQAAKTELAKATPVTTFAVGIGDTYPLDQNVYDPVFMANLAIAGGAPNQPCDPNEIQFDSNMCHFQVTPIFGSQDPTLLEQTMRVAFDKIRARVTSCDLTLVKTGTVDPSYVNVVFTDDGGNKQVVLEDPVNGWAYDDPSNPSKIVLKGEACAALKSNPAGDVKVVLGCKTITK